MCTANGTIKKTEISKYANYRKGGIIGINIEHGETGTALGERERRSVANSATAAGHDDGLVVERGFVVGWSRHWDSACRWARLVFAATSRESFR